MLLWFKTSLLLKYFFSFFVCISFIFPSYSCSDLWLVHYWLSSVRSRCVSTKLSTWMKYFFTEFTIKWCLIFSFLYDFTFLINFSRDVNILQVLNRKNLFSILLNIWSFFNLQVFLNNFFIWTYDFIKILFLVLNFDL